MPSKSITKKSSSNSKKSGSKSESRSKSIKLKKSKSKSKSGSISKKSKSKSKSGSKTSKKSSYKSNKSGSKKKTKCEIVESISSEDEEFITDEESNTYEDDNDATSSSDSIEDELDNIKYIKKDKKNPDFREIGFNDIDENFSYGNYGQFKVIIMKKNGYINATDLCKQAMKITRLQKPFGAWSRTDNASNLKEAASEESGLHIDDLLYTITGGKNTDIRGTYVHRLLICHIASWASSKFAMKVSYIVDEFFHREEKDEYEAKLLKEKNKIDRLNIKVDGLITENKKIHKDNKKIRVDNKKIRERLEHIYEQNEHLEEQNDDMIFKLDIIADNRVIPARHHKNNHSLVIIENNDNPAKFKKGTQLYRFSAIRVANKSLNTMLKQHKKRHRHMKAVLHIEYSPNSMNLWTRVREKLENVSEENKKIECKSRNFNLINDYTKKELIKKIKQIHNERLNTTNI